jgi:hypothetical protein
MAVTIDCDNPKDLVQQLKCLACLSELQLKQLLVIVLNDYLTTADRSSAYDLPSETSQLVSDSACYTCLSDKQLLQALLVFAGYITYNDDKEVSELVEDMSCFQCTDPKQVNAALMRILCLIVTDIGAPEQ